jgi:hypothetical protein
VSNKEDLYGNPLHRGMTFGEEFDNITDLADTVAPGKGNKITPELLANVFERIAAVRETRRKQDDLLKVLERSLVFQLDPPPRRAIASHEIRLFHCEKCKQVLGIGETVLHVNGRYWHQWKC